MHTKIATYLCCLVFFAFGMTLVIITPLLSEISKEFHLSLAQSGLFFSINFIGFMTFIFIGGVLAEKYGKKRIISVALIGLSSGLLAFGAAPVRTLAFVAVLFIGGFGGVIESMVSSLLTDLHGDHANYYINLAQVYLCAGAVFGPIMASLLVSKGLGWRISYFILAIFVFLLFIVFSQYKIEVVTTNGKIEFSKLKDTFTDRKFLVVCICVMLYAGSEAGVWGWMSTFLKAGFNISINDSAMIVGAFWIAMAVGRVLCGKLVKVFNTGHITIILAIVSGFVIILSGLLNGGTAMLIISIALGLTFSSQYPFLVSIGSKLRSNATAFSLMVGSGGLGNVIVPPLIGWVGERFNIRIAMMSPSILLFTMSAILIIGGYSKYGQADKYRTHNP